MDGVLRKLNCSPWTSSAKLKINNKRACLVLAILPEICNINHKANGFQDLSVRDNPLGRTKVKNESREVKLEGVGLHNMRYLRRNESTHIHIHLHHNSINQLGFVHIDVRGVKCRSQVEVRKDTLSLSESGHVLKIF